jgi:FlaA1/EpsC-like NDP-sugar epimerase
VHERLNRPANAMLSANSLPLVQRLPKGRKGVLRANVKRLNKVEKIDDEGQDSARALPAWLFHGYVRVFLDGLTAAMAMFNAYALRFDFQIDPKTQHSMWTWLCAVIVLRPLSLHLTPKGYQTTWRFFDVQDGLMLVVRSLPVTILLLFLRWCLPRVPIVPYSVLILEFTTFITLACGARLLRRLIHESAHRPSERPRAIIVGNDKTLATAVHHLLSGKEAQVVGLVSEDERLVGMQVAGRPVLGSPESLPGLLVNHRIEVVVLSGAHLKCSAQVIRDAHNLDVQVRILPSGGELIGGKVKVNRLVSIDQVTYANTPTMREAHPSVLRCFNARVVLITGAGGSIGSEIARQVSALNADRVVVLDQDENSVFELMRELGDTSRKEIIPIVGNIRDRETVCRAFERHCPHIVLHAAAYKHVPVMETNCCEAVLNNVAGTRQLVDAAIEFGCERLVMISTDKAVNPSSVMGATKRAAELLIQYRASESYDSVSRTNFACVRFGNVLGSRGSIVPIFLRQIATGGPVTITHREMTRYFMTIPQAVRLVLQAATLASRGEVYFLDMGDPVKIIDFAKDLIRLSGLTPEVDIDIKFVGARPGERLHEELWSQDSLVATTPFRDVFQVQATAVPPGFPQQLAELECAAVTRKPDAAIQELLRRLPIGYAADHVEAPIAAAN